VTPRERILAIMNREPVDRMPVDLWHTPEIVDLLMQHTGAGDDFDMWQRLNLDKIVWVFTDYRSEADEVSGSQVGALAMGQRTMWGVPLQDVEAGEAHYQEAVTAPLLGIESPAELDDYLYWPDPERFEYAAAMDLAQKALDHNFAVIGPWVSFFEIYSQLRGIEQSLMDLALNPALVEATLDRIEAIQTEMMHRFLSQAADLVDLVFISDDIGGQNGMLMSPRMWRRHLKPRLKRWCDLIHSYGVKVFYHTDGGVGPVIPELIEAGIDVLNPIQHACPGMDVEELARKYGDRVIFHGGIDNQQVLPFGTADDVRAETLRCLETLGAGREGYICCSCHNVQPGTPVESILAMIETVQSWRG
jgi:uroporphyrinogen decarboxylase